MICPWMGRWKTNISKIEKHLLALGTIHLVAASATSQGFHTQFNLPGKKQQQNAKESVFTNFMGNYKGSASVLKDFFLNCYKNDNLLYFYCN